MAGCRFVVAPDPLDVRLIEGPLDRAALRAVRARRLDRTRIAGIGACLIDVGAFSVVGGHPPELLPLWTQVDIALR